MHGVAFLLSQVGYRVSTGFAEGIAPLGLVPPHVGILRLVAQQPGLSQQALATTLAIPANRLVGMIDELERRELLRRERSAADRRVYELSLAPAGQELLGEIARVGMEQEAEVTAALDPEERARLAELLQRVADELGLARGIHPGLARQR
jgi:DNA-binding MarR family transcriptional regulator